MSLLLAAASCPVVTIGDWAHSQLQRSCMPFKAADVVLLGALGFLTPLLVALHRARPW